MGFVDGLEAPRYVGDKKQFQFFKFYVNNGSGKRIQVVAWNDEIERVEHTIQSNIVSISFLFIRFIIIIIISLKFLGIKYYLLIVFYLIYICFEKEKRQV